MPVQLLIAGFVLGAASSLHCVGMCGPIALSLPVHYLPAAQKNTGLVLYNIGRVATYVLLGAILGFFGRRFVLAGMQQGFSIVLGSLMLFFFLFSFFYKKQWLFAGFTRQLQKLIGRLLQQKSLPSMFLLGAANGLLPCGMVYFALVAALAEGSQAGAVFFMMAYGLGTIPAMFAISFFGSKIGFPLRNLFKKMAPFFLLLLGTLLILRGLNLNIPYLSPLLPANSQEVISCH
jgi:sulfite exporter TauE/SafE